MRSLDLPQILYQPFAATGDKNTILNSPSSDDPQRANLQTGFPAITQIPIANGGIPPERMDFNGLGYLLSSFYFFTQCGGIYTFNQDVSNAIGGYPLGAVLHYTDANGTTYNVRSLLENNTYNFVSDPSYIDDIHWSYVSSVPMELTRNIGQIIQSTIPLTDAGLHLLDGSVISGDGVYKDFYNYIASIVNTYPNLFITEAAWQAEVASHGVCGKFVFYEPNRTVRLPKITGITQSSESINALGDYIQAGLPNITGTGTCAMRYDMGNPTFNGCFTNVRNGSLGADEPVTTGKVYDFNASKSNAIYGASSTVQPPAIKVLYYIVVANSTKTDIEVDIDEIVTDLNGKATLDLSNCTVPHIVETYNNGTSWYRLYSDGWCEQGGRVKISSAWQTVPLIKNFANTNYSITANATNQIGGNFTDGGNGNACFVGIMGLTNSSFQAYTADDSSFNNSTICWRACGFIR